MRGKPHWWYRTLVHALWGLQLLDSGPVPFAEGLQASDLMGKRNIEAPEPTALGGLGKYQPVDRLDAFETLVIDLK
jgi:hypothetical protein